MNQRIMSRTLALLFVLTFTGAACAQGKPEPLVKLVKVSIDRGVRYLVSQQRPDGSWDTTQDDKTTNFSGGSTALCVLALLNCDDMLDDPNLEAKRKKAIAAGLNNLRTVKAETVYVRALQTMAFAEARIEPAIVKANAQWLIEARVFRKDEFIGWDYHNRPNAPATDASNSQYAMLALWYARQAGVEIPREVWQSIHDYYRRTQRKDGAWIYSPYYTTEDFKKPSVTMTVAGLCGLTISGMELNGGREQWQKNGRFKNCGIYGDSDNIAQAMHWISKNFTLDLPQRTYYHLYGLERAGRLSGLRFFGEHDWYREGCEYLVKKQEPTGAWKTQGGWDRWPHVNTSFALLFLSKGRTPVLVSKLVHGNFPRREDDADWNNDRNDLRHLTEYLSRDKELFNKKPLAWQTYDIMRALYARNAQNPTRADEDAIVADMRQSPILYITGHNSPLNRIQGTETALIKRYVENGGFIFAEACCGDTDFDAGFKQWVKNNWDQDLVYLESTDPVWTCHHRINAGDPFKLMALRVGCRTVILYSPQDLSCHWESNRHQDGVSKRAFELGANIVAFATGRVPPQPRLTPIEIASDIPTKESSTGGVFRVRQIRHSADWQPAPRAMTNLMEYVHDKTGLDVKLRPEPISLFETSAVTRAKFFYMHGKNEFRVDPKHLEGLRFTLENGGLLFADACCGDPAFDKAFRKFAQDLFPKEKLTRLPADAKERDPLFGPQVIGPQVNGPKGVMSAENIKCRTKTNGPMQAMEPFLEGIKIEGRWVVLYSKYDIGCALERSTSADCVGYDPDSAFKIAAAVVRYNTQP